MSEGNFDNGMGAFHCMCTFPRPSLGVGVSNRVLHRPRERRMVFDADPHHRCAPFVLSRVVSVGDEALVAGVPTLIER